MFHNENHNPFDDLIKISAANAGYPVQQKQASFDEPVDPYFAQGMNEEFNKIAKELQFEDDDVRTAGEKKRQAAAARTAAQNKAKAKPIAKGNATTPVKRAQEKAMKEDYKPSGSKWKAPSAKRPERQW